VWGVKVARPCLTYRVRERELVNVEVTMNETFKEAASTLHTVVFSLMAQRDGRTRLTARPVPDATAGAEGAGVGAAAVAAAAALKAAAREARRAAEAELPAGWTEITDPATGATAFWHATTRRTVFARPTGAV
jgi:hypothetical protein